MLRELAQLLGIQGSYTDFYGRVHEASETTLHALAATMGYRVKSDADAARFLRRLKRPASLDSVYVLDANAPHPITYHSRRAIRWTLTLESGETRDGIGHDGIVIEGPIPLGYHRLDVAGKTASIIATPQAAYLPEAFEDRKLWGIAAQLYSLRSANNWGIGDFTDLRTLLRVAQQTRAATVAVNPLHELTLANPSSPSPYSPTSRLYLNALYIDVEAAAEMLGKRELLRGSVDAGLLEQLRAATFVDYAGVAEVKLRVLRALHAEWPGSPEFERFRVRGDASLRLLATYEALMEELRGSDRRVYGWLQWPRQFHDPASVAVDKFARAHAGSVEFHTFLQWLADSQLEHASASATLAIGLYRDLAVGVDANSAEVWADREAYCLGASVGAPPDPMNPLGQSWGFTPFDPHVLRARAYAPFVTLLRANMRHAGALRIDHVMGLMRLFCTPAGHAATEGTYINYRLDEMLGILALESHRHRCMIVGEDLGTVPPGFRERLAHANIFGCRLLYFERDGNGRFREPDAYDSCAVASTGTHDVAPLAGFWSGFDVRERVQLGFYADEPAAHAAFADRATARKFLIDALIGHHFVGMDEARSLENAQDAASDELLFTLVLAAYKLLGRSAARLLLVQLEDVVLQREPVNTPGTFDEVPNWRRRLDMDVASLADSDRFQRLMHEVSATRIVR
ncbi:MAG TPA: 4-alpha-glucanotransferase [Candidatus Baltobacteraceae bacterium]|jgi:(1->4)-alpha-D-glucan 1-alpha-D-glucosylmutase